ncbi:MAG: PTS sugar transporter subunit IIA [Alphaproteobacteria bacterium]
MSFLLPNTGHIQLDVIMPRLKIKNPHDILNYLAAELAPAFFYTPEELAPALENSMQDAIAGDGMALPYLTLTRLTKPFTALITFDEPVHFEEGDATYVSSMLVLVLPEKDGALNKIRLARVSRLFRNKSLCRQIAEARSENEIFAALMVGSEQIAA